MPNKLTQREEKSQATKKYGMISSMFAKNTHIYSSIYIQNTYIYILICIYIDDKGLLYGKKEEIKGNEKPSSQPVNTGNESLLSNA